MRSVVAVFDTRLGKVEGTHNEAVLALWPMNGAQLSDKESGLVRIARGTLGLCSHFDEDSECELIELGSTTMVMQQLEPHIYWLVAAPSMSGALELSQDAGKRFLKRLHGLCVLMSQRTQTVLDGAGLDAARAQLQTFFNDLMPDVLQDEGWCTLRDLYTPMTAHLGLPLLPVPTSVFLGLQSMTASMAVSSGLPGDRVVLGTVVLFKSALLWSTLDQSDTQALYLLAARTVIPVTRIENKATEISKLYHSAKGSVVSSSAQHVLQPRAWKLHKDADSGGGFILCDCVPGGGTGGTSTRERTSLAAMREGPAGCPVLHLRDGQAACRMAVWQQHGLQIVVLLRGADPVYHSDLAVLKGELALHLLDLDMLAVEGWNMADHGRLAPGHLATQSLARVVAAHSKGHIQGSRYAFADHSGPFSRASPVAKFSTCPSSSMALMTHLWQDCRAHLQAEASRRKAKHEKLLFPGNRAQGQWNRKLPISSSPAGAGPLGLLESGKLEDMHLYSMGMEALALSYADKWVAAQWGCGCELLQVLEVADGEESFLRICDHVRGFSQEHFPGRLGP